MGVFVKASFRGDGRSLAARGGSDRSILEDLEMLAGGSGTGRWYHASTLLKRSTALLETIPVPVEASGSPVTAVAEIKPFFCLLSFSSFPMPTWMESSPFPCPAVLVLKGLQPLS